jgi:hypothetical protein
MEQGNMFEFVSRACVRPQQKRRSSKRLAVEALEERYALSTGVSLDPTGLSLQDVWSALGPLDCAPVISNFTAAESGSLWMFAGHVTDSGESVKGFTVTFGGLPSINGKTTTVNSAGNFVLTAVLGANENGTTTAQTVDAYGLKSNVAKAMVSQTP